MAKKVQPYGSAAETESAGLARRGPGAGAEPLSELASTMTVCELADHAAEAIRALNDLTADGGDLAGPGEVRHVIADLELIGQAVPQLCEQLARYLVAQREDGQVTHDAGQDPDFMMVEVVEALTAAGQAADMLTAALDQALQATAQLRSTRLAHPGPPR
jgi:hypothetical protein